MPYQSYLSVHNYSDRNYFRVNHHENNVEYFNSWIEIQNWLLFEIKHKQNIIKSITVRAPFLVSLRKIIFIKIVNSPIKTTNVSNERLQSMFWRKIAEINLNFVIKSGTSQNRGTALVLAVFSTFISILANHVLMGVAKIKVPWPK